MDRKIISIACVLGFLAIVLGAFGAHALKSVLNVEQLTTFETGVKYQMYHALFLLFVGTTTLLTEKAKRLIFIMITIGTCLFSFSIYLLATNSLTNFDYKFLGPITPIGGLLLIMGWLTCFLSILKKKG